MWQRGSILETAPSIGSILETPTPLVLVVARAKPHSPFGASTIVKLVDKRPGVNAPSVEHQSSRSCLCDDGKLDGSQPSTGPYGFNAAIGVEDSK